MSNIINKIKRTVLVVDDEIINQEILKEILSSKYDVITANNGLDAIHELTTQSKPISLIMLDINMPKMDGIEFLEILKEKNNKKIPVIVMTSEHDTELKSLELGAADFIKKPFEMPEIILARVNKSIELFEDRIIINASERDEVTQVYNKNVFKEYVLKLDEYNPDKKMDLNVLDIENFQIINEIYGKEKSDEIIRHIADILKKEVKELDGIVGRLEDEYFVLYHRHLKDYKKLTHTFEEILEEKYGITGVHFKLGVYEIDDKSIKPEVRINRAKLLCDHVGKDNHDNYLIYNKIEQDNSLYLEQLSYDFNNAIKNKEFVVYYQPKYNIEGNMPIISSAEALVRWNHHKFGLISPKIFIPLLEEKYLIKELDKYVWEEAIKQLSIWKKENKKYVPISINISRVDMVDESIVDCLLSLIKKYDIDSSYIYLEITESAYNSDISQLLNIITKLRENGFKIELDDFGSGYSSLNSLATIPFDVLKLDMLFVKEMYTNDKTLKMVKIVSDIAKFLEVKLVAEGVETVEQLNQLKEFGYQVIQGYYFSKPLTSAEFEKLLGGKQ